MQLLCFSISSAWRVALVFTSLALMGSLAQADVGLGNISDTGTDGAMTLYYPTKVAAAPCR